MLISTTNIIRAVVGNGYAVDNLGNIYGKRGNVLKPYQMKNGYYYVRLYLNGKNYTVASHRLVYESWYGKIMDDSLVVHHIDNNKLNNNIENLTLITRTENTCLSFKEGLQMTVGNKFKTNCKVLTLKEITELKHLKTMNCSNKRFAELFGVSTRTVSRYLSNKYKRKAICENE